jgi:hypothetical protein
LRCCSPVYITLFMFKLSFTLISNIKPQYLETYSISVFRHSISVFRWTGVTRGPTEDKSVHLVNKANLVHNLFLVYWLLVYLSICTFLADYVPIIRRNKCVFATLGTCCSVWMTVWYAGCTLMNILRINILRINCAPSWLYLQNYTGMHGQQNIKHKINLFIFSLPEDSKLELISEILNSLH